jgi:hypothetical protein
MSPLRLALVIAALVGCSKPYVPAGVDTSAPPTGTTPPTRPSPVDNDDDGSPGTEDCDDADPSAHPDAIERCDGVDNDCDGQTDESGGEGYVDADGDGHGGQERVTDCGPAAETNDDCDDEAPDVHPGATEVCNGVDEDCDGAVDDGVVLTWYADADLDGWGVLWPTVEACAAPPGFAAASGDCDDERAAVNPGAVEVCNTQDDDCDGTADEDGCACSVAWYPDALHPYLYCETADSWTAASNLCEAYGYRLVTLDSADELAWVQSTASSFAVTYWWLGYTDVASEGAWLWEDGSAVSYVNWCPSEPNNGHGGECVAESEEDCALLNWGAGGCWNDYPCSCGWGYAICEGLSELRPD